MGRLSLPIFCFTLALIPYLAESQAYFGGRFGGIYKSSDFFDKDDNSTGRKLPLKPDRLLLGIKAHPGPLGVKGHRRNKWPGPAFKQFPEKSTTGTTPTTATTPTSTTQTPSSPSSQEDEIQLPTTAVPQDYEMQNSTNIPATTFESSTDSTTPAPEVKAVEFSQESDPSTSQEMTTEREPVTEPLAVKETIIPLCDNDTTVNLFPESTISPESAASNPTNSENTTDESFREISLLNADPNNLKTNYLETSHVPSPNISNSEVPKSTETSNNETSTKPQIKEEDVALLITTLRSILAGLQNDGKEKKTEINDNVEYSTSNPISIDNFEKLNQTVVEEENSSTAESNLEDDTSTVLPFAKHHVTNTTSIETQSLPSSTETSSSSQSKADTSDSTSNATPTSTPPAFTSNFTVPSPVFTSNDTESSTSVPKFNFTSATTDSVVDNTAASSPSPSPETTSNATSVPTFDSNPSSTSNPISDSSSELTSSPLPNPTPSGTPEPAEHNLEEVNPNPETLNATNSPMQEEETLKTIGVSYENRESQSTSENIEKDISTTTPHDDISVHSGLANALPVLVEESDVTEANATDKPQDNLNTDGSTIKTKDEIESRTESEINLNEEPNVTSKVATVQLDEVTTVESMSNTELPTSSKPLEGHVQVNHVTELPSFNQNTDIPLHVSSSSPSASDNVETTEYPNTNPSVLKEHNEEVSTPIASPSTLVDLINGMMKFPSSEQPEGSEIEKANLPSELDAHPTAELEKTSQNQTISEPSSESTESLKPLEDKSSPKQVDDEIPESSTDITEDEQVTQGPFHSVDDQQYTQGPFHSVDDQQYTQGPFHSVDDEQFTQGPFQSLDDEQFTQGPFQSLDDAQFTQGPFQGLSDEQVTEGIISLLEEIKRLNISTDQVHSGLQGVIEDSHITEKNSGEKHKETFLNITVEGTELPNTLKLIQDEEKAVEEVIGKQEISKVEDSPDNKAANDTKIVLNESNHHQINATSDHGPSTEKTAEPSSTDKPQSDAPKPENEPEQEEVGILKKTENVFTSYWQKAKDYVTKVFS